MLKRVGAVLAVLFLSSIPASAFADEPDAATLAAIDRNFDEWRLEAHVPGLVYGVVKDGRVIVIKGQGVQDLEAKRPVDSGTRFRIASMSKAFTALAILKLRDEGKLSLDALAETYIPEMRGWTYPTSDSPRIRVRDLLNHDAGFVTDDPWGDRQQPMSEADFTAMLKTGVRFARPPGLTMEYSNFGYATLGRIVTRVSGKRFQDYIRDSFFIPLGMTSTTYDIARSPADRRALGYRWQDEAWLREPDMPDGVFGAMGGVETTAQDYARWTAFLLSAWPPRDDPDTGPVKRATVREIAEGSNFVQTAMRAAAIGGAPCRQAIAYGMGWRVVDDCDLGHALIHAGGYPGYGSNVLLLPDKGLAVFAFTNRTYSGPSVPVFRTALALHAGNALTSHPIPVSKAVADGYALAKAIWAAGDASVAQDSLAMNFLLDHDLAHRKAELAEVRNQVGLCPASEPVVAESALAGNFTWTCERGRLKGSLLVAPTQKLGLQALGFEVVKL
ncbi:beta-lactamase family protein [Novosphingobium sp. G106]|uniref:serine hydrolase domain-containing protein n=1 Tax=Novosphingobium sp. G106 TaxID=2849500 RepID=UPI001C2DBDD5|nr:serine hydrolase domain-containing protein [Novosphingobium sp. G106]MBV1686857.1 beta-lactamase family protein [Novosphingobium sp. G106]